MDRYRIEIDYTGPDEYSFGVVSGAEPGEPASKREIANVLELVARLIRQDWPEDDEYSSRVRYPGGET